MGATSFAKVGAAAEEGEPPDWPHDKAADKKITSRSERRRFIRGALRKIERNQREYKQEDARAQGRVNGWCEQVSGAGACLDLGTGASYFLDTARHFYEFLLFSAQRDGSRMARNRRYAPGTR